VRFLARIRPFAAAPIAVRAFRRESLDWRTKKRFEATSESTYGVTLLKARQKRKCNATEGYKSLHVVSVKRHEHNRNCVKFVEIRILLKSAESWIGVKRTSQIAHPSGNCGYKCGDSGKALHILTTQ
jgi:hypothetical protein